jgi:hypothetical protein
VSCLKPHRTCNEHQWRRLMYVEWADEWPGKVDVPIGDRDTFLPDAFHVNVTSSIAHACIFPLSAFLKTQ